MRFDERLLVRVCGVRLQGDRFDMVALTVSGYLDDRNSGAMREHALQLLRIAVGDPNAEFRPGQWEAIEALLQRNRLLVVERTGWGKSIVYFLATRLIRESAGGVTLLISPLLSLMRNQILAASKIGVRAETINSANENDWQRIQTALRRNEIDVLLISPERLANEEFVTRCLLPIATRIGMLVVDEAHCISDWGHDFRPDYRRIVRIVQALPPNVPMLATTATANDRVVEDIESQLGPNLTTIRGGLTRESLRLQNLRLPTRTARMAWIAHTVPRLDGSGIIYTLTIKDAAIVARWLRQKGIAAEEYHAGLDSQVRENLEGQLLRNELKVLVATVALGMGFDKPDLGFVIHFQRPASAVHYYQQVGRAGRALPTAHGVLLSGSEDNEIAEYFLNSAFPTEQQVREVIEAVEQFCPIKINRLEEQLNVTSTRLSQILKFLSMESPAPISRTPEGFVRNPVEWSMPRERISRIRSLRRNEQLQMEAYVSHQRCLMVFLQNELSDPTVTPCGKCANCAPGLPSDYPEQFAIEAAAFLNNLEIPIEPRKRWPVGLEFEGMRGMIRPEHQMETGRALCRWGDAGFGELVKIGKQQNGRFDDSLVDATVTLIRRWNPQPPPEWITCVPSTRHPHLVSDFARRLSSRLGIPFVDSISKIGENEAQKTRENSFQQVRNLENVFQVQTTRVQRAPVFLVDDMVDSRWTITVLTVKLRQAGSGPVFPLTIADSSAGDGD